MVCWSFYATETTVKLAKRMSNSSTAGHTGNDVFHLTGVVDFDTAPQLLEQVNEQILPNGSLVVDFSGVSRANSAALALLLAWQERAEQQQCTLNHQNLPESIQKLSTICQVSELI